LTGVLEADEGTRTLDLHAKDTILAGYDDRLEVDADSVAALMGASFTRWADFDYAQAIHLLNRLVEVEPDGLYGNLFSGSSRLLQGGRGPDHVGEAYLERAIELAPEPGRPLHRRRRLHVRSA
jgi:hypothetical protein